MFISGHYVNLWKRYKRWDVTCGGATSAEYSNGKAAFRTSAEPQETSKYINISLKMIISFNTQKLQSMFSALGHPYKQYGTQRRPLQFL